MQSFLEEGLALMRRESLDELLYNGDRAVVGLRGANRAYEGPPAFAERAIFIRSLQEWAQSRGQRLDPLQPAAGGEACLDGEQLRWYALLPPVVADGPLFSLRRHRFSSLRPADFAGYERHGPAIAAAYAAGRSLFVAGATGAGKTSFMVSLLRAQSYAERVFLLEDLREIPALSPSWVSLCPRRPNVDGQGAFLLSQVFEATLRLRPDRFVVGELRGTEVDVLMQVMLSGHGGTMTSLHLSEPQHLPLRLAQMSQHYEEESLRATLRVLNPMIIMMARGEAGQPTIVDAQAYSSFFPI